MKFLICFPLWSKLPNVIATRYERVIAKRSMNAEHIYIYSQTHSGDHPPCKRYFFLAIILESFSCTSVLVIYASFREKFATIVQPHHFTYQIPTYLGYHTLPQISAPGGDRSKIPTTIRMSLESSYSMELG